MPPLFSKIMWRRTSLYFNCGIIYFHISTVRGNLVLPFICSLLSSFVFARSVSTMLPAEYYKNYIVFSFASWVILPLAGSRHTHRILPQLYQASSAILPSPLLISVAHPSTTMISLYLEFLWVAPMTYPLLFSLTSPSIFPCLDKTDSISLTLSAPLWSHSRLSNTLVLLVCWWCRDVKEWWEAAPRRWEASRRGWTQCCQTPKPILSYSAYWTYSCWPKLSHPHKERYVNQTCFL